VAMRLRAIGQRSTTVRRSNLSAIVRELHASGPLSRSALVARTGLTRTAIRGLIAEFVTADLVTEERSEPLGSPGRPSPLVRLNPRGAVVLALDIAVDSLAAGLVGLGGDVIECVRVQRPRGRSSVDDVVDGVLELAAPLRARREAEALIGVGVAVVGLVRRDDGFVSTAPNLGWRNVSLGDRLAAEFGANMPIAIANEADLGAVAELRRGAARGSDDLLYISGEVGVGGGLIVGGKPLAGAAGFGGEIGHLPLNPDGRPCHCGSVGCWETEVGEEALLRLAGRAPEGGWNEVEAVLADAREGSPVALAALDQVGRWMGVGVAGLINILNPRLVVLGGLFGRIHPFVVRAIEREVAWRALAAPLALVTIVPGQLGVDAPLLGAAELAFEPMLADPAAWLRPRPSLAHLASA
jgi:predicted NBD/HSP70 family sugar kinase